MVFNDIDNLYIGNEAQDKIYLGDFLVWSGTQPVPTQPNDEIWYTSSTGQVVTPDSAETATFGAEIASNTYVNGKGVIKFDGPVTSIGLRAFRNCSDLTSITMPDSVTSIGSNAFNGCGLTSITIPNSVTSIGTNAFQECDLLSAVTIGNGVTSIAARAFRNCVSLISITCLATTPPTISSGVFSGLPSIYYIYVPAASVNAYKAQWTDYASRIQAIPD